MPGVPERWEQYTAIGRTVGDTNFIPFKVPLKPALCNRLPEVKRFTPFDLLSVVKRLKLIIDLTNTRRYYNAEDFTKSGVHYVKIFCQGHGKIPGPETITKFYQAIHQFLRESNDGYIGVHCTHGLNRTGYLICRYMIENLDYSAENAINEFNKARGHDIERTEYLRDLYNVEARRLRARNKPEREIRKNEGSSKGSNLARECSVNGALSGIPRSLQPRSRSDFSESCCQTDVYYPLPPMFYQLKSANGDGDGKKRRHVDWNDHDRQYQGNGRQYHELYNGAKFELSWRQRHTHKPSHNNKQYIGRHQVN